MLEHEADELIRFPHVRVVGSTAPALFCAVDGRHVWLPRAHIKGNLWRRGDRGSLRIRRWVALDRHLTLPGATARAALRPGEAGRLRLRRGLRAVPRGH